MTLPLPQAPPSEAAAVGAETLARLADGLPVLTNGGRVLLVPAEDFPRDLAACGARSQTTPSRASADEVPSQARAQGGGMSEFPVDAKLDLRGALGATNEFVELVKRVAALEVRMTKLEKYVHPRGR
ncbi:hypothetical protein UFOVP1244_96 [uncultured Caudovirales phage]|uniref:Uncharacterized protein n=1 Tax=uncultured Caudovirales phage TaxID=2100421 RepID=A0A6J5REM9_9CAUD|nr:hypothetical protein UFOVP1244_96 [uncultured Caudovirales phage]